MNRIILYFILVIFYGCSPARNENPHVIISTPLGDIQAEIYAQKAPRTAAAFLSFIDSGFYTNSSFYRVVMLEGFSPSDNVGLIQGGIYQTNDKQHGNVPGIVHESTRETGLSHTSGTLSLARTSPGTANTEFFICIGDQTQFDYGMGGGTDSLGFAAFGKVVKGMAIVRKIQQQPRSDEHFNRNIVINKIRRY